MAAESGVSGQAVEGRLPEVVLQPTGLQTDAYK